MVRFNSVGTMPMCPSMFHRSKMAREVLIGKGSKGNDLPKIMMATAVRGTSGSIFWLIASGPVIVS